MHQVELLRARAFDSTKMPGPIAYWTGTGLVIAVIAVATAGIWWGLRCRTGPESATARALRDLPGMAARIKQVIFVFLSRGDVASDSIRGALGLRCACLFSAARHTKAYDECDCVQCNS